MLSVSTTLSLDLLRLRSSLAADCSRVDSRRSTRLIVEAPSLQHEMKGDRHFSERQQRLSRQPTANPSDTEMR